MLFDCATGIVLAGLAPDFSAIPRISAMERLVLGSLAVTALLASSQVNALDREGAFDAVVHAAIYT